MGTGRMRVSRALVHPTELGRDDLKPKLLCDGRRDRRKFGGASARAVFFASVI
jgi:ribosomal protein S9